MRHQLTIRHYERVILNQLCSFIEKHQSGFCKGHSTNTLSLQLRDDIRTAINRSEVTLPVLIGYAKAFETIDHRILLGKLQNMNFAKTIKIICSCLIKRYQYVQIEDKRSTLLLMFFGDFREVY